jgi:hypothetical protein
LPYCSKKFFSRLRRLNRAGQNSFEIDLATVKFARGVLVLFDHGAIKTYAGKQTARARVCEDFGAKLPIGGAFGMPSYRPRGD